MDLLTTSDAPAASALGSASGISSSSAPASLPKKTRSACNRCHSQKLRCIKVNGQVSCERCLKLKRACKFSPRAPRASVKHSQAVNPSSQDEFHEFLPATLNSNESANHNDSGLNARSRLLPIHTETAVAEKETLFPGIFYDLPDQSWPFLFPELPNLESVCQDGSTLSNMMSGNESDIVRLGDQDSNASFGMSQTSPVQKLASLNVALHECAQNLPTINQTDRDHAAGLGSKKATIFAIDDLLRLTAEFIEVTKCLCNQKNEPSSIFSSIYPIQTGSGHQLPLHDFGILRDDSFSFTAQEPPTRSSSRLDEATISLIFSCHCRAGEIYVSLFQMMQDCIAKSLRPQLGSNWAVILPRLQVGSIASSAMRVDIHTPTPSKASSAMYILMITMLSSQLWEEIADLMKVGVDFAIGSPPEYSSPLVELMRGTMRDRTEHLLQTIDATKHMLKQ